MAQTFVHQLYGCVVHHKMDPSPWPQIILKDDQLRNHQFFSINMPTTLCLVHISSYVTLWRVIALTLVRCACPITQKIHQGSLNHSSLQIFPDRPPLQNFTKLPWDLSPEVVFFTGMNLFTQKVIPLVCNLTRLLQIPAKLNFNCKCSNSEQDANARGNRAGPHCFWEA